MSIVIAFIAKHWRIIGEALLIGGLIIVVKQNAGLAFRAGQSDQRWKTADSTARADSVQLVTLNGRQSHVDTMLVHDTLRLPPLYARVDTLRAEAVHDTVFQHDTTAQRLVAAQDQTIKACRETVTDCATARAIAEQRVVNLTDQLTQANVKLANRKAPEPVKHWGIGGTLGYGGVYRRGAILGGPGGTFGVIWKF